MKSLFRIFISGFLLIIIVNNKLFAQENKVENSLPDNKRMLPFGAAWAKEKGIELPLPFGVSIYTIFMSRDIEVTSVSVEFMEHELKNIEEFASFGVRNQSSVTAIKFDAWILPMLNFYILGGHANYSANVNAKLTIEHDILPLPPSEFDFEIETRMKGPYAGIGSTLVGGYGNWFVLGDANYGKSWPDGFETPVDFMFISFRSGFSIKLDSKIGMKLWLGGAYLNSKTTLEKKVYTDFINEIMVYIKQEPSNPWTAHCGLMVNLGKHFDVMAELGSNFNDASVSVFTASWRF